MSCPRCEDRIIIDPDFLAEVKNTFVDLTAQLVVFANEHKIDHRRWPILTQVARTIRFIEQL